MDKKQEATFGDELEQLFPGRPVVLGKVKIVVYPIGFQQFTQFSQAIARVVHKLARIPQPRDHETGKIQWDEMATIYLPVVADALVNDLLGLVQACCVPDLSKHRVPHWVLADVLSAWVEENFGSEDRVRPWVQAVERLLSSVLKEKVDLWETFSKVSSPAAIASMKSSFASKMASHTPGGPSSSSGTGQDTPSATSAPDAQTSSLT